MSDVTIKIKSPKDSLDLLIEYTLSDRFIEAYSGCRVFKKHDNVYHAHKIDGNVADKTFRVLVGKEVSGPDSRRFTLRTTSNFINLKFNKLEDKNQYIKDGLIAVKLMCINLEEFSNKRKNNYGF